MSALLGSMVDIDYHNRNNAKLMTSLAEVVPLSSGALRSIKHVTSDGLWINRKARLMCSFHSKRIWCILWIFSSAVFFFFVLFFSKIVRLLCSLHTNSIQCILWIFSAVFFCFFWQQSKRRFKLCDVFVEIFSRQSHQNNFLRK